jgi:hypothetical protein
MFLLFAGVISKLSILVLKFFIVVQDSVLLGMI